MFIKIPFQISNGSVELETDVKKSVDSFIDMLVSTQYGHFKSDPNFGFVFKNHRFENFDEIKGTLATKSSQDVWSELKIEGSSKNPQNFAHALKRNIEAYEKRLHVSEVLMSHDKKKHIIKLSVSGELQTEHCTPYSHEITFNVW